MIRKLPPEAFEVYLSQGLERSYSAVAKHFGVSKVAVTNRAVKEKWQERLAKIEEEARDAFDKRAAQSQEEMRDRHMKVARAIQTKALQALQRHSLSSAIEAVKALETAVKMERTAAREVSERTAVILAAVRSFCERTSDSGH